MKFSKERVKTIIKEELKRFEEGIRTEFPVHDPDAPEPPNAGRMEAVSKEVENQIFHEMEEMIVELGNIVVTINSNNMKVDQLAAEVWNILHEAGFRMPSRTKYNDILEKLEAEYAEEDWSDDEVQKAKDAWGPFGSGGDDHIDVDDI